MRFYTSYYGNRQLDPSRYFLVRISNSSPKGVNTDYVIKEAIPDWKALVEPFKNGSLTQTDYILRYRRQLDSRQFTILLELDTIQTLADGKDVVFLCYEKPGEFCHRHIFAQWLSERENDYRVEVEELRTKDEQMTLF